MGLKKTLVNIVLGTTIALSSFGLNGCGDKKESVYSSAENESYTLAKKIAGDDPNNFAKSYVGGDVIYHSKNMKVKFTEKETSSEEDGTIEVVIVNRQAGSILAGNQVIENKKGRTGLAFTHMDMAGTGQGYSDMIILAKENFGIVYINPNGSWKRACTDGSSQRSVDQMGPEDANPSDVSRYLELIKELKLKYPAR